MFSNREDTIELTPDDVVNILGYKLTPAEGDAPAKLDVTLQLRDGRDYSPADGLVLLLTNGVNHLRFTPPVADAAPAADATPVSVDTSAADANSEQILADLKKLEDEVAAPPPSKKKAAPAPAPAEEAPAEEAPAAPAEEASAPADQEAAS